MDEHKGAQACTLLVSLADGEQRLLPNLDFLPYRTLYIRFWARFTPQNLIYKVQNFIYKVKNIIYTVF